MTRSYRIRLSFTTLFVLLFLSSPKLFAEAYILSQDLSVQPASVVAPPELTELLLSASPKGFKQPDGQESRAQAPIIIKSETFEGAFPNDWDVFDNDGATNGEVFWLDTNFRANSGSWSGWSAGGGADGVGAGNNYPHNMSSWMVYGPFDLSDATLAVADFMVWLDTPEGDSISLLSSINGTNFNGSQWSGSTADNWAPLQLDLAATGAVGEATVWLAFIFESDAFVNAGGAYVDDIVISKQTGVPDFDLDLYTIDVANEIYGQGGTISITTGVENIGSTASPAWTIRYYLSTDANITNADTSLGSLSGLPALNAAESTLFPVSALLPSPLANGNYYIGAIIETADANAANNTNHDASAITVNSDQDIRIRPVSITIEGAPGLSPEAISANEPGYLRTPARAKTEALNELLSRVDQRGQINVIVGFDQPFMPEGMLSAAAQLGQQASINSAQARLSASLQGMNFTEKARFQYIPYMALRVDAQALQALVNNPDVVSIEEDRLAKPLMDSSNPVIGSPIAWAGGMDGSSQAVAILDTGVYTSHAWFTTGGSRIVSEACYSADNGAFTDPLCPGGESSSIAPGSGINCAGLAGCDHGTHVAGTVAGNNGAGPGYGVARDANIIAIQVFSKFLTEGDCGFGQAPCALSYSSDQILALERVLTLSGGMDIASVNMSLGGGQYFNQASCDSQNSAVKTAIDNLAAAGIATVIAAGNDGFTTSTSTPGCISTAITVGATNDKDAVAGFSNIASFIDLLAPGVAIVSSVPGGTGSKQGTSMATPHVAGAWAVLKEYAPESTVADVLSALQTSGTVVDDLRVGGSITGMRRINVEQGLASLGYATESFGISNEGFSTLNVTSIAPSVASSWLTFSPPAPFSIAPGRMQVVDVIVDFDTVPEGVTNRTIVVQSNDPNENPYPGGIALSVNNGGVGPAPTATVITPVTTGPTNADSVGFSVTFSEDVINFNDASDVTITHSGTASTGVTISGSGSSYTAEVTGISGNGSFTLKANTGSDIEDTSGQGLESSVTSASVNIDNLPPGISIGLPDTSLTRTGPVSYPVTYTGASNVALAMGDVSLVKSGSSNGDVAVSGAGPSARTVTISNITGTGTLAISIAAGTATDAAGNSAPSHPASESFVVDNTAPTVVSITPDTTGPTAATEVNFAIEFSEPVMNFNDAGDVIITHSGTSHATVAVSGSGSSFSADVTGIDGNGSFTLKVNTGSGVQDLAGNPLVSSIESAAVTIDNEPPGISISAPSVESTLTGPVSYTISYTGAALIVPNLIDFVSLVTTGTADAGTIEVTGSGEVERVVTLSDITGTGTLAISIGAATASDTAGNTAGAAGPSQAVLIALINEIFMDGFESPDP